MAGIPNRKKAISLVAISTPGDLKTYPTGTYCVPADGDGTFLLSDSTVPAQFSWSSGSNGGIYYEKTTGATNVSVLTASNIYVSNAQSKLNQQNAYLESTLLNFLLEIEKSFVALRMTSPLRFSKELNNSAKASFVFASILLCFSMSL